MTALLSGKNVHVRRKVHGATTASVSPAFGATAAREADDSRARSHSLAPGEDSAAGQWHNSGSATRSAMLNELSSTVLSGHYPHMFYFCNKYASIHRKAEVRFEAYCKNHRY